MYPSNAKCGWILDGTGGIVIDFTSFDTEKHFDQVKVYIGNSTSGPIFRSFSGAVLPLGVVVPSSTVLVMFTADGTVERSGFRALVRSSSVCARDASCFDKKYRCAGCCATGLAEDASSCWDSVYTAARCCAATSPPLMGLPLDSAAPLFPGTSSPVFPPPWFPPPYAESAATIGTCVNCCARDWR